VDGRSKLGIQYHRVVREGSVTCNDEKQVTSIALVNMGLSGLLSLTSWLILMFQTTRILRGHLLPAALQFAPLEILDVAGNRLTDLVLTGLCRKAGINGNDIERIYSCDVIACRGGHAHQRGGLI
jgi:hypothetical protein